MRDERPAFLKYALDNNSDRNVFKLIRQGPVIILIRRHVLYHNPKFYSARISIALKKRWWSMIQDDRYSKLVTTKAFLKVKLPTPFCKKPFIVFTGWNDDMNNAGYNPDIVPTTQGINKRGMTIFQFNSNRFKEINLIVDSNMAN